MIQKGDKVRIVGSAEASKYKSCIFEVLSDPYTVCGSTVVKIKCHETGKYFGGGYAIEFLRKVDLIDFNREYVIDCFDGTFDFLSNFYPAPDVFDGVKYLNSEAAFQAQKCIDSSARVEFADLEPMKAKRLGRKICLRPDWDEIRISMMYQIVLAKFSQNPELEQKLLDTGFAYLIEGNYWRDTFWGVCNGVGENHLGQILMRVREELRQNNTK